MIMPSFMLFAICSVLGKAECVKRIASAIDKN